MNENTINLEKTIVTPDNTRAKITSHFELESPGQNVTEYLKVLRKFEEIVATFLEVLKLDKSHSIKGGIYDSGDGWKVPYSIEYLTALDLLKSDKTIQALIAADALREMNGLLYIWEGLNQNLLYNLHITCGFFEKPEYSGLIVTRSGKPPKYNTVKHYMDEH